MSTTLGFGYNRGLPDGITRAWGARMIVDQRGHTDLLGNRTSWLGEPDETQALQDWLNGSAGNGALAKAREAASDKLRSYEILTRTASEVTLYEDETGKIVGNTNASAGYLYIAAWLKADVPTEASA